MIDIHPHPLHWLHFENSYALVYARQLQRPQDQTNLPLIPAPTFRSELRADLPGRRKVLGPSFIKLELAHYFAQNRIFAAFDTETPTPAYSLLNFGLGADIVNKQAKVLFSLYANANNLLDVGYQSHLSRLKYAPDNPATGRSGIFNMGRNISFKLVIPLTLK